MGERRLDRPRRLGKPGQKWVDAFYNAKEAAKGQNGGVLPHSESLVTTPFPHCDEWSEENLPEILFYLQVPKSKYSGLPLKNLVEDGKPAMRDDGRPVREFEILPSRIALDVPGWLIETWRRIDSRITYQDILDRQVADPTFGGIGLKKLSKNALQNHCRRDCRKALLCWVEYGRRDEPHRTEIETIEALSEENIVFNTSLKPCEIAPHRLGRVRLTRKTEGGHFVTEPLTVTEENYKYTTFPIDHFVKHLPTQKRRQDMMTPAMKNAFNMLLRLHERAMFHNVEKWSNLPKSCLPVTWFDRTKYKSVANPTGDGGCSICTWEYGKVPLDMPDPDVKVPTTPTTKSKSKKRVQSSLAITDDESIFGECVQPPTKKKRSRKGELEVTDPTILIVNTSEDNQLPTPPSGRKSCPARHILSSDSDSSAEVWQDASSDSEDDTDSCDDPHYSPGSAPSSDGEIHVDKNHPRSPQPTCEDLVDSRNQFPLRTAKDMDPVEARLLRGIGYWTKHGNAGAATFLRGPLHEQTCSSSYVPVESQYRPVNGFGQPLFGYHSDHMLGSQPLAYFSTMPAGNDIATPFSFSTASTRSFNSNLFSCSTAASSFDRSAEIQDDQYDLPSYNHYVAPPKRSYCSPPTPNYQVARNCSYYAANPEFDDIGLTTLCSSPIKRSALQVDPALGKLRSASFSEGTAPMRTAFGQEIHRRQSDYDMFNPIFTRDLQVGICGEDITVDPSLLSDSHGYLMSDDVVAEQFDDSPKDKTRNRLVPMAGVEELLETAAEDRMEMRTPPPLEVY